jgi:hypothetical protein
MRTALLPFVVTLVFGVLACRNVPDEDALQSSSAITVETLDTVIGSAVASATGDEINERTHAFMTAHPDILQLTYASIGRFVETVTSHDGQDVVHVDHAMAEVYSSGALARRRRSIDVDLD